MCAATDVPRHFCIMCFRCRFLARVWIDLCTSSVYMRPGAIYSCMYWGFKYLLWRNDHNFLERKIRAYSPELVLCKQLWSLKCSVCLGEAPVPSLKQLFLTDDICPWSIREIPLMTYNNLQKINKKKKNNCSLPPQQGRPRWRKKGLSLYFFVSLFNYHCLGKKPCLIPAFQSNSSVYLPLQQEFETLYLMNKEFFLDVCFHSCRVVFSDWMIFRWTTIKTENIHQEDILSSIS